MKRQGTLTCQPLSRRFAILLMCMLACVLVARAQTGPNSVWGIVNQSPAQVASYAFIDASVFPGNDICAQIYNALTYLPPGTPGVVIDARGISTGLTCVSGTPWVQGSNSTTNPSTILLPAETIVLITPWVLPDRTRLVGEHTTDGSQSTLEVLSVPGFNADNTNSMVEMGSSLLCPAGCTGISIEHMTLYAAGLGVSAIYNGYAGDQSYVNDVALRTL